MFCEQCKENLACVHLTKIVDGEKTEKHLCSQCASKNGEIPFAGDGFAVHDFLKAFFNQHSETQASNEVICPNCGMAFSDFNNKGKIGCAICYNVFGEHLDSLLRRIHRTSSHAGKIPQRAGEAVAIRMKLKGLRQELERYVSREDYENAARIRDEIRSTERALPSEL